MKIIPGILSFIIFSVTVFSQDVSNWKILTNMSTVRDISVTDEGLWGATTGGVFYNNFSDNSYQTFTRSEGITGINLTSIAIDKNGRVWMGSSTGTIDIFDPEKSTVKTILDIYNSDKTSKQINQITASGDSIVVSTDFGVCTIDLNTLLFVDTYSKFGNLTSNIKVNSTLKDALFYTATDSGVAIQKAGSLNLSAPESWDVYSRSNGLPVSKVSKVIFHQNNLLAATERGIYTFNGTLWTPFISSFSDSVADLISNGQTLFVATKNAIYTYSSGNINLLFQPPATVTSLALSTQLQLYAGTSQGVFRIFNDGNSEIIMPNGPQVNQFPSLSVDNNGVLWSASGTDKTGQGFYKYENSLWTNYNQSNHPEFPSNFYFSVFTASDNATYFGNWGKSFLRVRDDVITVFPQSITGMAGIATDPNFIVISSFATDSRNNLWILNYWPSDRRPLSMLTPDSVWYHFSTRAETQSYEQHYNLIIDQYDTKWYSLRDPSRAGLYYFNENKTYTNPDDDRAGYRNTSFGLNSNSISSLIIDRRGDIWVGTAEGVNVISNTSSVLSQAEPQLRISNVFALRQQSVNCMAADPLNQKWVGTNQGLLLVNSDGSSLLQSFNTSNSPLLTDIIKSIAIDEKSGIVYVGTDMGITSFQTTAMMPQDTFTELIIYPSPFLLNSGDNTLTIDGLIRDTDIKIITTNGKLINEFSSPGGYRATWDGRDLDGNLVNSGIYFIIAFDKEGNNVSTGKVAILR